MDLIAGLRTFLRVAETGSFSAVAAERGITQPAISRQVTALEEQLGARLVHRTTQAVALTDEGRDLIRAAQELVDAAEALEHSVGRRRKDPIGRVRLAVPVPLGLHLSSELRPLLDQHRELSIELVLRDGISDFVEEGLDLEVRVGPIVDSALIARRIGWTKSFVVASPRYLRDRSIPKHPNDLKDLDCIVYHRWGEDNVWWFSSAEGELSVTVHGRIRANNAEAVRRASLAGMGVAQLSHLMAEEDVRAGRLQVLLPDFRPLRFPLSVVYPSRRNLPPRTRIVIQFLAELLHADPAMRDAESVTPNCGELLESDKTRQ
jgi:DNA-binding transcriptional LysR family regulator